MMEEKRFYIRILSPVHIGCDEVYDPTGFVINEEAMTLTAFEPMDFFRSLNVQDKSRYIDICSKGTIESIMELYKFMKGKHYDGHRVDACKGLVAQYKKTLSIPVGDRRKIQQELNNFSIARTAFNPTTQKPYIPGSAIKGAFRTAYLNYLSKNKKITYDQRDRNQANTLEKGLLEYQKLENDPFRLLRISDFHPAEPCKTSIVYAVNAKKVPSQYPARGAYQILEVIEPDTIFTGSIQILEPLTRDVIKTPITAEKVFDGAGIFYGKEKQREDDELKSAGLPIVHFNSDGRICPLRIGRHSGAESLTIEGHRHIKIMKKKGDRPAYLDKATTFWLASDIPDSTKHDVLKPFGWVSLGLMTEAVHDKLKALAATQENIATTSASALQTKATPIQEKVVVKPLIVEETWNQVHVSFDAGKGGVIIATAAAGKKAQLTGKEKAMAATDEKLRKKLFEGKKTLSGARVTVRKTGNAYEIVHVG